MENIKELIDQLIGIIGRYPSVAVAYSGGVDSAVVLRAALMASPKVHGVIFHTMLHPMEETSEAVKLAKEMGAAVQVIEVDEFTNPAITDNPPDRCYHCKHMLFTKLKAYAREHELEVVMDGTNGDDLNQYRPGLRALKELEVVSPLAQMGLDKQQVRLMAKELGLPVSVSDKPSAPCLATRLPYNTPFDREVLDRIARGEEYLKACGFQTVRLRLHGDIARLEIPKVDFGLFLEQAEGIASQLKKLGFTYITLDLEGFRSGSMDYYILRGMDTGGANGEE